MTRVIWKHIISHPETGILFRPGDRILSAATQDGNPCVWAEHDGDVIGGPTRIVRAVPTGRGPKPGDEFIGTCHDVGGAGLVMHLYLTPEG